MYNDGKRIILGFLANIYKRLRASVIFIRTFIPYSTMKMKHHHKLTTATLLAGIWLYFLKRKDGHPYFYNHTTKQVE